MDRVQRWTGSKMDEQAEVGRAGNHRYFLVLSQFVVSTLPALVPFLGVIFSVGSRNQSLSRLGLFVSHKYRKRSLTDYLCLRSPIYWLSCLGLQAVGHAIHRTGLSSPFSFFFQQVYERPVARVNESMV